ncbi:MAG: hypothetical protein JW864_03830 [Spirochaetes bacterium]|nr:hypothetical protein [Spirochaetota bacterium]
MNFYVIIGIIFIALGTFFTYYGSYVSNKSDKKENALILQTKINDVVDKIDSIKTSDLNSSESNAKLNEIKNEFMNWANDFNKNQEMHKIEYKKAILQIEEKEIEICNKWRKQIEYPFITLRNLIDAINKNRKPSIQYNIPSLPINYCSGDIIATITFSKDYIWSLSIANNSIKDYGAPSLTLSIANSDPLKNYRSKGDVEYYIFIYPDQNRICFRVNNNKLALTGLKDSAQITEYKKFFDILLKTSLERQLAILTK